MAGTDLQLTKQLTEEHERILLWGSDIPGNSSRQKSEVMEAVIRKNPGKIRTILDTLRWLKALVGSEYKDRKKAIDTYVMNYVRGADLDYRDTFTDKPYLIPFIAEGSRQAVIVVPGGGYCLKSMESEGTQIAEKLQSEGITAFVLWYRTCPYYMPIPLLDMQRAVRLVRSMSERYGYEPDRISAVGFSGGGAQVSLFLHCFQGNEMKIDGYQPDTIDAIDDRLNAAALVYPALSYNENMPMLFASFPAEQARNPEIRAKLIAQYDAIRHYKSLSIPQFFCYGTKDNMVSLTEFKKYMELSGTDDPNRLVVVEGAGHGYGASVGGKYGFWLEEYAMWLKQLYL